MPAIDRKCFDCKQTAPSTGSASVVKLHSWHPASPSGALFILHHSPGLINARDRRETKKEKNDIAERVAASLRFHHHAIPKPYITIQDTCYMSHRLLQAHITSARRPRDPMTSPEMKLVGSIG